jgi:hypothetical protein
VVLLLAASASFAAVLLWLQPPPPACLVLIGSGYEDNLGLPPNVPGRLALEQFAQMALGSSPWSSIGTKSGQLRLFDGIKEFRAGDDWLAGLEKCPESTIVVFLAAHVGADADGPFLLPGDADAAPESRVRFEQVLDRLAEVPARKNKVLLIDGTQLDDHWPLGMLHNDFPRALAALEPQIAAIPNLVVLVSCGVDQLSYDRGPGDTTVFSHFLMDSLARKARAANGRFLSAWDLHVDVQARVQDWTRTYRQAEQTPMLLPRLEGERRARAIPLAFHLQPPPAAEAIDPLPGVLALWQRYENLRRESPAALIRTPRLWRRLESLTRRHEQLLMAGEQVSVARIRDMALDVEGEIRRKQILPLKSTDVSLTMPALAGEMVLDFPASYAPFEQLWTARADDRPALWARVQLAEGPGLTEQALVRRRVYESLVRRAAEDPQRNLPLAAELVHLVQGTSKATLPAEVHFLLMLQRDLPKPLSEQPAPQVARALRLRLLAEQAAMCHQPNTIPYSEYVLPWVQASIEAADADRRLGEDLLFATEAGDLAEAARYLDQAERTYRQAIADAAIARLAIQQRDEGLFQLTHYARWATRCRGRALQEMGPSMVEIWASVHQLGELLRAGPTGSKLQDLRHLAEEIRSGLAKLQTRFDEHVQSASRAGEADLEEIRAILEVPTLPLSVRTVLLQRRLQLERRALEDVRPPEASRPAQADYAEGVRMRARLRGELALAALGQRWFDHCTGADHEPYAEVLDRLRTFAVEEPWWQSLNRAGGEIGHRWRRLDAEPDRLVEAARRETDPARACLLLWEGDQLVRRNLVPSSAGLASTKLRRLLAIHALTFEASRVEADHWAEQRPAAVPYYQTAARALLHDARLIGERESLPATGIAEALARLEGEDALGLQATERASLTPGERARLTVALAAPLRPGMTGFPMVWGDVPTSAAGKDALDLAGGLPGRRTAVAIGPGKTPEPLRLEIGSPLLERLESAPPLSPAPLPARVNWSALHRGFRVERVTEVSLCPRAEITSRRDESPQSAAVAVAADRALLRQAGLARGALAIVLDCTGSMGTSTVQPTPQPTRFQLVSQALRTLLENVPAGTTVSLWVFGQAVGEDRTVVPERTIVRLQDPMTWTADEAQVRQVMSRVEKLMPWNESPVLRAMLAARQDLLRADGPRTMMVLTDGIDNRFAKDREGNPSGESVRDALRRRFQGTGIALHVIGFQVASHEEAEAHEQFGVVKEMDPPGTFCRVDQVEDLVDSVRRVGRATIEYRLAATDERAPGVGRSPLSGLVGPQDEPLRWLAIPLAGRAGVFHLGFVPGKTTVNDVAVNPGDALNLRLALRGMRFGLKRAPFVAPGDLPAGRLQERGGWIAAVAKYDQASGGLRLLLTLEPQPSEGENPIRVRRPSDLWIEMQSTDGRAVATTWSPWYGYPAPAWKIECPAWPADASQSAALRAWWLSDGPAAPLATLRRGQDFRSPAGIARPVRVEGGEWTLDSVQVEFRPMESGEGGKSSPSPPRWCVAVRVSYPSGQPVRASLDGLGRLSCEEHRYYHAAGKYVGLFAIAGATTHDEVKDRLERDLQALQLTSLAALRQAAEKEAHAAEFLDLGKPAAGTVTLERLVPLE